MRKTFSPKLNEVEREWHVVDAKGLALGRLSSRIAQILMGKTKPTYTPYHDVGDFVIVINADKVVLTGRKEEQKVYYRQSGRPGGLKEETAAKLRQRRPIRLVEYAVKGMLPKNRMGRHQYSKLKVYAGPDHPHAAQKPAVLPTENIG